MAAAIRCGYRSDTGIWEIFIPDIGEGQPYKYEIIGPDGVRLPLKADPLRLPLGTAPGDRLDHRVAGTPRLGR